PLSHIPDQSEPMEEVIGGSERDEGIVAQPSGVDERGNEPCRATRQDCDMQPSIGVTVECWGKGAPSPCRSRPVEPAGHREPTISDGLASLAARRRLEYTLSKVPFCRRTAKIGL